MWSLADQLYYVMQVIEVIRHPRDKAESKYNPDVGMTKEDEERYQKLVAENEELQKLISAVRLFIFYFLPVMKTVECGIGKCISGNYIFYLEQDLAF
jgi:hypothetical protein